MSRKEKFNLCLIIFLLIGSGCTPSSTEISPTITTLKTEKPSIVALLSLPPPTATKLAKPSLVSPAPTPALLPTAKPIDLPRFRPGHSITFTSISMITANIGWGTSLGHILYTEDGGNTWQDVTPPEAILLEPDSKEQAIGAFLDEEHAWVVFSDIDQAPIFIRVWITHNAGQSWAASHEISIGGMGDFFEVMLRVIDPWTGWLLTDVIAMGTGRNDLYRLFHTVDGGASWSETLLKFPYVVSDIEFADKYTGWMTEEKTGPYVDPVEPFIDITLDSGANWETIDLIPPSQDTDLFTRYDFCSTYDAIFHTKELGAVVVECFHRGYTDPDFTSYLYSTSDGGTIWRTDLLPLSIREGSSLILFNANDGLLLGRDMYRTSDGGQNWTKIKTVNWDGQFSFISENIGFAVASNEEDIALVKTEDGCQTWEILEPQIVASETISQGPANTPPIVDAKPTPMGGGSGQIAFISWRDNPDDWRPNDIFLMNSDGSGITKLTDSSGVIYNFTWSPDGGQIAFSSDRDGDAEIYIINADGSGMTQLTSNSIVDDEPAWSPSGDRIAFVSNRDGEYSIHVVNVDGSQVQKLTEGRTPAWSPDGTQIAFAIPEDGIYVMSADGGDRMKLTDSSQHYYDWYPAWSPDGSQILFASNRHSPGDALVESVYVMNADGTDIRRLSEAWGLPPYAWSPDGALIAYTHDFFSLAMLYIMSEDGANVKQLMGDNEGVHPQWRP